MSEFWRDTLDPTPLLATIFMLWLGHQISLTPAIIPTPPEIYTSKANLNQ